MKRACLAFLVLVPFALGACGDDETTTVTETVSTEATTTQAETTTGGPGPSGTLTASGVGSVTRGTTEDAAAALFGRRSSR